MQNRRKVLLLEDDELLSETIEELLHDKYEIVRVSNGLEALDAHFGETFDLYILDINVPKLNGKEFLRYLREKGDDIPAIFITSYTDKETLKEAYEAGADDYIKKPFDIDELLYRIEAILHRYNNTEDLIHLTDDCVYDTKQRAIIRNGEKIILPVKTFKLLELLIKNQGKCTTIDEIINHLWHPSEEPSIGSIRIYINRIRKLIGKEKIKNIKGEGYILDL
ncbi:MAG: DNA-binding response regulator [Epsilonproteobacteria bacterium]|nr:DNA-binding response regulator [Campylobacterota bacterium]NPA64598.1 response regulator transcription factor [Campylobacterota bacterium]